MLILIGGLSWGSYHTEIAYRSYLVFILVSALAVLMLSYADRKRHFALLILPAILLPIHLHLIEALNAVNGTDSLELLGTSQYLVSQIEICFILGIFALALSIDHNGEGSSNLRTPLIASLIVSSILVWVIQLMASGAFAGLMVSNAQLVALTLLGLCGLLLLASFNALRNWNPRISVIDRVGLASSLILLFLASLFFSAAVIGATTWVYAESLWIVSTTILFLSIAVPYLRRGSISPHRATSLSALLVLVFLLPLFVTLTGEAFIQTYFYQDFGAYIVSHLGAASLSMLLAVLTLTHARSRRLPFLYPLASVFASWSFAELSQVVITHLVFPPIDESLVPYITGNLVSVIALLVAVHFTQSSPEWPHRIQGWVWILLGLSSQGVLLLIGEVTQSVLIAGMVVVAHSPLGRSIILVTTLISASLFVYIVTNLGRRSGGKLSPEVIVTGFLSLWIIPNILKANFLDWSYGWWTAEIFILIALILGPGAIGILYLREMDETDSSHQQARMFSDLLVHDVSNYHQAIMLSLDLLDVEGVRESLKSDVLKEARGELVRADALIRNVRQLSLAESFNEESLVPIDIVACLNDSFDSVSPKATRSGIEFEVSHKPGECYVLAHELLEGVFVNLFRNSLKYSTGKKRIEVDLREIQQDGIRLWEVRVSDYGPGIDPAQRQNFFRRFMSGAKGVGLGLSVARSITEAFGGTIQQPACVLP